MNGAPPDPADPLPEPGPPGQPRTGSREWLVGMAGALVLVAIVAFLTGRQSGTATDGAATTSTTLQPAVTAGPGWSRSDAETVGALALALEQSSAVRALSTSTVLAVERCAVPLAQAAAQFDSIIAQRRSIIDDVESLDASGGLRVAAETLGEALHSSLRADEARKRWVDWLTAEWSATYNGDCWPPGQTPTDANIELAQVETAKAAAARVSFLSLFNPLATAASLRTWESTEF